MKKIITILLFLSPVLLIAQQTDQQQLLTRIKELNDAVFIQRDSLKLLAITDANLTYGHSGGKIENKAEMVHNAMVSKTTYSDFVMEEPTVMIEGNVGISRQVLKAKSYDAQGKEGVLHLNVLQTWIKKGRDWFLLARQAVKLP